MSIKYSQKSHYKKRFPDLLLPAAFTFTRRLTLALTAGVALELVQKVTGHKTTDIVLKHYFQPGRETFRTALNKT